MNHRLILLLLVAVAARAICSGLATAQTSRASSCSPTSRTSPTTRCRWSGFSTYSNQWDVEGLVATTSVHQRDKIAAWRIREIVEAYGKVRDNLEKHEPGYPDGGLSAVRHPRGPAGLRHGGRRRGHGLARLGPDHPGGGPRRSAPGLGARVGRSQLPRPGAVEGPRDPLARGAATGSSPSSASTRSPTRTTAGRGSARRSRASSTSPAPASTPAAPITTPPGAASAATNSTAGSPAPTSASSTTPGSTRTSAARVRSARSIRARSS